MLETTVYSNIPYLTEYRVARCPCAVCNGNARHLSECSIARWECFSRNSNVNVYFA